MRRKWSRRRFSLVKWSVGNQESGGCHTEFDVVWRWGRQPSDQAQEHTALRLKTSPESARCLISSCTIKRHNTVLNKLKKSLRVGWTDAHQIFSLYQKKSTWRPQTFSKRIRSAVPENPMLHANSTALCLIEPRLLPKFYILGIGILDLFGSCDLDFDLMTFIYELDP